MVRRYIFGDEAGTLQFSAKASRYFIVTTVTMADCAAGDALLALRRDLAWEGFATHPRFHATEEHQSVRDRVFDALASFDFRIDATIFEKRKALPRNRQSEAYFYQFAWYYHLKFLCDYRLTQPDLSLLVVTATVAERPKKQAAFANAVTSVLNQVARVSEARSTFWMGGTDPCLWVADYACWAIQRRWEHTWKGRPDTRSYDLIKAKIGSEYDLFAPGTKYYY